MPSLLYRTVATGAVCFTMILRNRPSSAKGTITDECHSHLISQARAKLLSGVASCGSDELTLFASNVPQEKLGVVGTGRQFVGLRVEVHRHHKVGVARKVVLQHALGTKMKHVGRYVSTTGHSRTTAAAGHKSTWCIKWCGHCTVARSHTFVVRSSEHDASSVESCDHATSEIPWRCGGGR